MKDSYTCHDFDVDYYLKCQLLEHEPKICDAQSSNIVGIVCDQSPQSNRFNLFQTSSRDCKINYDYE